MATENLTWHASQVTAELRRHHLRQTGGVVWLTGLSGSGKSTVAAALEHHLVTGGHFAAVLDGDNLRHGLCADLGFGEADRRENIRRAGAVAALFADAGVIAITAFISPYRAERETARARLAPGRGLEVHLATPLEVCEARDPKGLYRRARAGEIRDFTGLDAPYEPPLTPEVTLDTQSLGPEACVARLVEALTSRGMITPDGLATDRRQNTSPATPAAPG
jgi:adenylylsulfate kinase